MRQADVGWDKQAVKRKMWPAKNQSNEGRVFELSECRLRRPTFGFVLVYSV
jgi:hypothetical protein